HPADRLYLTIDPSRLEVDDRVVLSSNLNLTGDQAAQDLLAGLGFPGVTAARYFNNAVDTRTRGVDVVGTWSVPLAASNLDLTASYNHNKTEVTRIAPNPAALASLGANLERIGRDERGRIEEGAPRDKFAVGALWNLAQWDFSANATRYGEFTSRHASIAAQDQTYSARWTLDTAVSFRPATG